MGLFVTETRAVILASLMVTMTETVGVTTGTPQGEVSITEYYVDATSGNDTNNGGVGSTWKTIAKVNGSTFKAGDSIYFKKDETWAEQLTVPSSGSAGLPITFGAYGSGADPAIGTGTAGIIINNKDFITIDGFTIIGTTRCVYAYTGSDNLIVQNCTISGATLANAMAGGIVLNGSSNTLIDNNTISTCYQGIVISGYKAATGIANDSITVSNNTISGIQKAGVNVVNGDITTPITDGIKPTNIIVEYNDISTAGILATGVDTAGIHTLMNGDGLIIRYNKIYDCGLDPTTVKCSGIMIDEDGGTAQVYYNLCYNNSQSGISTSTDGVAIYNNTLYLHREGIALFHSGQGYEAINCLIKNNIVVQTGTNPYTVVSNRSVTAGTNTWSNNIYYGSASATPFGYDNADGNWAGNHSFADWQGHVTDGGSSVADPLFVNAAGGDLRVQSISPCIDAGVDVGLIVDYVGTSVPQGTGYDIGAYESFYIPVTRSESAGVSESRGLRLDLLASRIESVGASEDQELRLDLLVAKVEAVRIWEWRVFPLGEHEVYGVPIRIFMKGRN